MLRVVVRGSMLALPFVLATGGLTASAASYVGMVNKGTAAYNKGQYVEAVQLLLEAEARDPSRPEAPATLGWAYYSLTLYDEALDAFMRSIAVGESVQALKGAAFCHWALSRYSAMLPFARRWSELSPGDPDALAAVGVAALYSGQIPSALAALRRATATASTASYDALLAEACLAAGDTAGARAAAERGLRTVSEGPFRSSLERWQGHAALAAGDTGEARRILGGPTLAAGLVHDPEQPVLRVRWVMPDGPAGRAGLRSGDLVRGFDGSLDMASFSDASFDALIRSMTWGSTLVLHVDRGSASLDIPVVLSFENGDVQSAPQPREERVDAVPQPDVAGDDLATESRLTVTGVQVEPERVVQGQAFRVAVDLVASGPSGSSVSVTFDISIVRSGQALATTTLTAEAPSGRMWRITKEVPRAAGDPGRYTVQVEARAGLASASGSAGLEIVAP